MHVGRLSVLYCVASVSEHKQYLQLSYALLQCQHDILTGPQQLLRLLLQQTRA